LVCPEASVTLPLPVPIYPDVIVGCESVLVTGAELPSPRNPDVPADRSPIIDWLVDHRGCIDDPGGAKGIDGQECGRAGQEAAGKVAVMVSMVTPVVPMMPASRLGRQDQPTQY